MPDCPVQALYGGASVEYSGEFVFCRSGQLIFVLSNWMSDPKCTPEIRNRWLDIWGQVRCASMGGGICTFLLLWLQIHCAGICLLCLECVQVAPGAAT